MKKKIKDKKGEKMDDRESDGRWNEDDERCMGLSWGNTYHVNHWRVLHQAIKIFSPQRCGVFKEKDDNGRWT